ncbi:hypothetical protein PtA15_4A312 [Puccinia triticina]|uniref:RlpA-like protein double-psi beta-barrel domain-containing protein n=1 Tax=Puccinia triticina TaxID=208348 RepID=A0ABY7CHP7_9BASI|nr:uncharacterized protein PtA15_4A312 [Puccinia triticina]WAQ83863.1 hypothetical protein PtA15_4A312 [Puccinia triticina]
MFCRAITPLFSLAVLFLIVIGPSICRPLSRRGVLSQPSSSLHRFFRRSTSTLSPSSHRRRSMEDDQGEEFLPFAPMSIDVEDSGNLRRSIDTDLDDSQDDLSQESIDQEKADADKDWAQFVASGPDEDPDSYPDSFAQDDDSDSSCSQETDASKNVPKTPPALISSNDNGKVQSPPSQNGADSKQQNSKYSGPDKQQDDEAEKAKQEADQAKAAEDAKKSAAQGNNQVTDVKPIPGTSVTTGTVHKDHKGDSYSTPSAETHTGDATYYEPGLGSCGLTNGPGDMIVAVSKLLYDSFPSQGGNPNTNEVCGKKIRATYQGRSCEVTVVDRCEACLEGALDFTITAFEKLGKKEEGRLHGMTWTFI